MSASPLSRQGRRSLDGAAAAAQHLLRHLGDPAALARNPLVSSLFEQGDSDGGRTPWATSGVHALIRACAERLRFDGATAPQARESRERQYQILVRCDLGNEPHAIVAADLALSRRQFYRERRAASEYLARFLAERAARPRAVSVDRFALEMSRAKSLRLSGEAQRSGDILRALVQSAEGAARKIEPWCALIDLLINSNRTSEAEAELRQAHHLLQHSNGIRQSDAAQLRARVDMQRASYLWFQGLTRETAAIDSRTEGVIAAMSRSASADAREFYVATRLRQVQCELMSGTIERARSDIEQLRAYMSAAGEVPLSIKIFFLIALGYVKDHGADGSEEALALLSEALSLAQRHGFVELVIEAMSQLSSHAQLLGDHATGMRYVYEILPVAEHFGLPSQYGMLLNVAAISEASLGHHDAALALARRARAVLAPNSLERIYSSLAEAQARLSTSAYAEAATAGNDAFQAAERIRSDRLAGTALRLMAEGAAGLGLREDAHAYALCAVARLEREGPPFALLQAYQAAARITGEARLRAQAGELAAALRRATP